LPKFSDTVTLISKHIYSQSTIFSKK